MRTNLRRKKSLKKGRSPLLRREPQSLLYTFKTRKMLPKLKNQWAEGQCIPSLPTSRAITGFRKSQLHLPLRISWMKLNKLYKKTWSKTTTPGVDKNGLLLGQDTFLIPTANEGIPAFVRHKVLRGWRPHPFWSPLSASCLVSQSPIHGFKISITKPVSIHLFPYFYCWLKAVKSINRIVHSDLWVEKSTYHAMYSMNLLTSITKQ